MSPDVSQIVKQRLAAQDQAAAAQEVIDEDARRQEVRAAALEWGKTWAGITRKEAPDLPAGYQGDPDHCVFANLLGGRWNGECWQPHEGPTQITCPPEVVEFIQRFDSGEYPDLADLRESEQVPADLAD